jgi:hypothetical protein
MNYLLQGLAVFLGVIAGTVVTILTQLYLQKHAETQQTHNLKFEIALNSQKIDAWLDMLGRYRNAVNGDSLHTCYDYFDVSRIISVTASAMLQSGLLYKKLTDEQISLLLVFFSESTGQAEQVINSQFGNFRQEFERCRAEGDMTDWVKSVKPEAVSVVNFWEKKFQEHQRVLNQIVATLR